MNNDKYKLLLYEIKNIIKNGVRNEDDEIILKNSIKYDLYNLIIKLDREFIDELYKEIEYKENIK